MIQLYRKEKVLPLKLLFELMLEEDIFPDDMKKVM